ncbi:MAG: protein kinase [Planctomycetes bacterium]|nr:protein kinase [Planctomycetota bacterium]
MHPTREDRAAELFDVHARFAADRARGGLRPVEEYLPSFPGLEDEVRAIYAATTTDSELEPEEAPKAEPERRVGHYRLLRELGRGGQGAVHLAEDTQLGRKVALKMLTGVAQFSSDARRRFQREAETASRLDHPSICTIYESGFEGELAYIAMRFVEGETLSRRLARVREGGADGAERTPCAPGNRAELAETLRFFEEAARGLHAAHEAGVIHRDVKPGNVMMSANGGPVLLDFGLARALESTGESITHTGDQVGTPSYMSPEQIDAQGRALDRRTDVYSLGVTLYECLTLEPPFQRPTLASLYHAILREPPRDPRSWTRSIPRELVVVLETALEKDRDRRYTTALEFAEDLRRVRELQPIHARPASLGLRTLRWVQRHPARSIASGAFVLLFTALVFVIVLSGQASQLRVANVEIQSRKDALEQQDKDERMRERLLDLLAETPMRGEWHDWAAECRSYLDAFAGYGIDLASPDASASAVAAICSARSRSTSVDGGVADELLDGLYRIVWTIDEARGARVQEADDLPVDLRVEVARGEEWEGLHSRLLAMIDQLEPSDPKRRSWRAHRAFVANRTDEYDGLVEEARGPTWSSGDRIRLAELVYIARRNGVAIDMLDLAEQSSDLSPAQRFTVRFERGALRLEQGDAQRARIDLDVSRELRPRCAAAHVALSDAWWRLGDAPKALAFARRAAALAPDSSKAVNRHASMALRSRELDEAMVAATAGRRLAPTDPGPLCVLGELAMLREDEPGAVDAWMEAADLVSDARAHWNQVGRALRRARGGRADASFIRGLGLSARDTAWVLEGCARSARTERDRSAELELFEAAHAAAPEDADIAADLGRLLVAAGQTARAVEPLRLAVEHEPGARGPAVELARALLSLGERDAAGRALEDAFSATADAGVSDDRVLAFADACLSAGSLARAEELARRCVAAEPEALDRRRLLGNVLEARGDLEGALGQQFEVLSLAPRNSEAFERASWMLARASTPMDSRLEELCALHPANAAFASLRARFQYGLRDPEAALQLLDRASTLDPASELASACASDLCIAAGRMSAAIVHARAALERQPGSVFARLLLSRALNGAGEYAAALRVAEDTLASAPGDPKVLAEWVGSASVLGLHQSVIDRCAAILASAPERFDCRVYEVSALKRSGAFDLAEARIRSFMERASERQYWMGELADVLFEAQRWAESAQAYASLGRETGLAPEQVGTKYKRHDIACRRALASKSESTPSGRADLDRRSAMELAGLGRFRRAAAAFARGPQPADPSSAEAQQWVAVYAECCARAAFEAWNEGDSKREVVAAVEASATPDGSVQEPRADAAGLAARALELLEARLERRAHALEREQAPARRSEYAAQLENELFDPGLLPVRVPPASAPWAERARTHVWRVREQLTVAKRSEK